jgi:peptide/nickel transport system substrate-binding protein
VYGPLSKSTPSYWPGVEKYYPYDPKAAAALLDEAGWKVGPDGIRVKDGQRLTIHYSAISVIEPETAVEVQAQLKKIGFDIDVEVITLAKRDDMAMNNQDDLETLRWLSGDPSCLEVMFHSRNIPKPGYAKFNWSHLNNPDLDSILERAAGAADPAARDDLYAQAQKIIMDNAVFVPVHDQVNTVAYRANRTGYRWARTQWNVRFYEVTEAK